MVLKHQEILSIYSHLKRSKMKAYIIVMLSLAIVSHAGRVVKRISKGKYIALVNLMYIFAYIIALVFACYIHF